MAMRALGVLFKQNQHSFKPFVETDTLYGPHINLIAKLLLFGGVVDDPEEMPIREGEEDFAKRHKGLGMQYTNIGWSYPSPRLSPHRT
jgi:hypothetical protein